MSFIGLLPWHHDAWQQARSSFSSVHAAHDTSTMSLLGDDQEAPQPKRRPSAWLIHGASGTGKRQLASALLAAHVCEQPQATGEACGACPACLWLKQGQHPDVRVVGGQLPGIQIPDGDADGKSAKESAKDSSKVSDDQAGGNQGDVGIDEVRAIASFVNIGSHRRGLRVAAFPRADRLSIPAANALLKTLEEPPADMLFILVTDRLKDLPATVISRCRKLLVASPSAAQAASWLSEQGVGDPQRVLAAAGGAPLTALTLSQQPEHPLWTVADLLARPQAQDWSMAAAERCLKLPMEQVIDSLQRWVVDLMQVHAGAAPRFFPSQLKILNGLADNLVQDRLLEFADQLAQQRARAHHPLNARLRLETLFAGYRRCFAGGRR